MFTECFKNIYARVSNNNIKNVKNVNMSITNSIKFIEISKNMIIIGKK